MKAKTKPARTALMKATPETPLQWKPDRAWHAEQRKYLTLFEQLRNVHAPELIAESKDEDTRIFFARDSTGKEWFFMDEPKFQHPGEWCLKVIPRKSAFGIICLWSIPSCLRDYMLTVLKKGGAW